MSAERGTAKTPALRTRLKSASGSNKAAQKSGRNSPGSPDELAGITALYAALGELNEAILRAADRDSLFQQACAIAVRQGHFRSAVLWWIDPAKPREAVRAGLAVSPQSKISPRTVINLDNPVSYSSAVHALTKGEADCCNDAQANAGIKDHFSWKSCAAFPLRENGRLAGALALYSSLAGSFGPEVMALLSRIADDLSLALDNFVREEERRKMEAALRQREHQLRTITDSLPAMIAYWDTDARYRFLNRGYELFYGRPRESMLGRLITDVLTEKQLKDTTLGTTGRYNPGPARRYVRTMEDHAGTTRHFQTLTLPDIDAEGKEIGRFILSMDISELHEAQAALRESEERFQLAVRGSSDGLWDFNLKTGARYFSPRFKEILGFAEGQLGNDYESITSLMAPQDRDRVDEALRRHLRERAPFDIECRMHHRNGAWVWMRLRGQALWDDSGRAVRMAGSATDITDRKLIEEKLLQLAHYDALTGLPNRVTFQDRIEQSLLQATRNDWQVGVLFVDLDRFKSVNDTLGHAAGDELLRQVSHRLTSALRSGDTVGRLSGDEFALLLPDLRGPETARIVASKVIEQLSKAFRLGEKEAFIGASVGIAVSPQDGRFPEELLKNADAAMYRAKELGRGNFQFFSPVLNDDARDSLRQQHSLRTAIESQALSLTFQPRMRLGSAGITVLEALPQWQPPGLDALTGHALMAFADESGLVLPLGTWMIGAACEQAAAWGRAGADCPRMAVLLSKRLMRENDIVATVSHALQSTGLHPRQLELEVEESLLLDKQCAPELDKLHALGVCIAIGNFGVGYSSLSYLKRFEVDVLKIDRSLVQNIAANANDMTITSAIVALAHKLGCTAVASGVEQPAQRDLLQTLGCDEYQGPLACPPCTEEEVASLLRR